MSDNGPEVKLGRNASTMCKLLCIGAPIIGSGLRCTKSPRRLFAHPTTHPIIMIT